MKTKQLIDEAMSLPVEERVLVIDTLLKSLNQPQSIIDQKWALIARQRVAELRGGAVKPVSGKEVFEKIWNKYER